MIQRFKRFSVTMAAIFTLAMPLAFAGAASAQSPDPTNAVCTGASTLQLQPDGSPGTGCTGTSGTPDKVNKLITDIINIFSVVVGIVAVIMIIYAGFRYITSGGKQESVTAAKNTILYGIIGLIIVALAQVIVKFVLNKSFTATQ